METVLMLISILLLPALMILQYLLCHSWLSQAGQRLMLAAGIAA